MNMTAKYHPLWTALVTPMSDTGEVDIDSFISLLKLQEEAKNGILILGSTGEGLALTDEEKLLIVKTAAELNLSVPLMVGVGGFNINDCKTWIRSCQKQNIQAFLLVTPLYAKPGPVGQVEWFKDLLDTASLPCMLYNVPSRAGTSLHIDVLNELSTHKNFWSLKEASGSVEKFKEYAKWKNDIELFSGDDPLTHDFCQEGGVGLVSVMANVWPKETAKYVSYCLDNKPEVIFPVWKNIADSLFEVSNPIPTKVLLQHLKMISSAQLRSPLSINELKKLDKQIQANEMVSKWSKEH